MGPGVGGCSDLQNREENVKSTLEMGTESLKCQTKCYPDCQRCIKKKKEK